MPIGLVSQLLLFCTLLLNLAMLRP